MANLEPKLKNRKNSGISLNWSHLNAILTGVSAIDLTNLSIKNRADAAAFAREYGFDVDDPLAHEEIRGVHQEALTFIDDFFLEEDQKPLIPSEVRQPENMLDLLVLSSKINPPNLEKMWACAVLKVMHGIFHMDHDSKLMYFDEIRRQIFESIDRVILHSEDQDFLTDGGTRIPLIKVERKRNKGRKSILLKLLQKPSYVASDIYDHLGVRFVFETRTECLFALKLMRNSHLITVTNVKPFRSRNNLVDLQKARDVFEQYRPTLNNSEGYPFDILRRMDEELELIEHNYDHNPHSSRAFQSIQVTARKMIRLTNPVHRMIQELGEAGRGTMPVQLLAEVEKHREMSFYFDYEIQLLDRSSYYNALYGPASHEAYKRRQRKTARKRVFGMDLIRYLENR